MRKFIIFLPVLILLVGCGKRGNYLFEKEIKEHKDIIVVFSPEPFQKIKSPLIIKGKARGFWFFEGDFPVILVDEKNNVIINGIAKAESDWMRDGFVKFSAVLKFKKSKARKGYLILKKDNPSEKKQLDDMLVIPVYFK